MPVYRIDLAYRGTAFHGYAKQPNVVTVQGLLEAALERVIGPVETTVAGRTDKGVHASGQVVSFETDSPVDDLRLSRSLNKQLSPDIAVLALGPAPAGFSARFSAVGRAYEYRILNREAPDPFLADTSWHYPGELDAARMAAAMVPLIGEHDFASFCRAVEGRSTVRDLRTAQWDRDGDLLAFRVEASSFCHQMVRSLVALSVDVGRGRIEPEAVGGILEAEDRNAAVGAAPPHGLTLMRVDYPDELGSAP